MFFHKKPLYIFIWLIVLVFIIAILCAPVESPVIAGYLMPVIFYSLHVSDKPSELCSHLSALGRFCTPAADLQLQLPERVIGLFASFILSVLISFAICLSFTCRGFTCVASG